MDLQKALNLLNDYRSADVFIQNDLAIEFMEKYASNLISLCLKCHCDLKREEEVEKLFKEVEKDIINTLNENRKKYLIRKEEIK